MDDHPKPHHGGSYVRKPDGALELTERTAPHPEPHEMTPAPSAEPERRSTKRKES